VSVDSSFLTFAGVRPLIGRNFSREEVTPNGPSAVLLSESFWRRQFGGARNVVGKTIRADGQLLTIIGVLPASLRLPDYESDPPDVWLPLVNGREQRLRGVLARVRPGVSIGAAEAELDSVIARVGVPDNDVPGSRTRLVMPGETLGFRRALVMLSGAVALLLLVACANVAHLLLARAATRERELAVRYALGAGRSRLVRQLLTESLVLSLLGGALATVVGVGALRLSAALRPAKLSALAQVSERSHGVWLVAGALALSTGIVVGLLVGLRAARRGVGESLRVGSAGGIGRRSRRLRSSLVVTEIALSATLLVGALLLVHGVINLEDTRLGFDSRRLYGVTISLRGTQFESAAARNTVAQQLLERGRRIRGVVGVTLAGTVPPRAGFLFGNFETPERPATSDDPSTASTNFVSSDYFSVMGISLIGGRTFGATSAERNEAIINETMAKRLWPDGVGMPIGKRFRLAGDGPNRDVNPSRWYVVIGVSQRAATHGLLDDIDEPTVYSPLAAGLENGRVSLIVRATEGVDPTSALRQLASVMASAGSIPAITNVEQALNESIAEPRFSMMVLTTFAGLAVVLAAIGLYGVISYTVAQRTREIGIRMTLGATRSAIARLVVADGLRLAIAGVVLGLLGAALATRLIQTALYGVQREDPWSFAAGAVLLIGVSAMACLIPTLRATAVDPVIAVRAE
jgi:putative ABC transport system permease protein